LQILINTIKTLAALAFFWLLVLAEVSFFRYFRVVFHPLFVGFFLIVFFNSRKRAGYGWALLAGALADIFFSFPFGIFCLTFLSLKVIIEKTAPLFSEKNCFGFLVIFSVSFIFYCFFPVLLSWTVFRLINSSFVLTVNFGVVSFFLSALANLLLAIPCFLIFCFFYRKKSKNKLSAYAFSS